MNLIIELEKSMMRSDLPDFRSGDTVAVHYKIKEGDRERIQVFEGVVIAKKSGGVRETFIVRKVSYGVGVERIFPLHSPLIDKIEVKKKGKVRKAKLYYLRGRSKKASRIKERSRYDQIVPANGQAQLPAETDVEIEADAGRQRKTTPRLSNNKNYFYSRSMAFDPPDSAPAFKSSRSQVGAPQTYYYSRSLNFTTISSLKSRTKQVCQYPCSSKHSKDHFSTFLTFSFLVGSPIARRASSLVIPTARVIIFYSPPYLL